MEGGPHPCQMCPDERLQAPRPAGEEPLDCNEARNSGGGLQRRRWVGLYCFYLLCIYFFFYQYFNFQM